MRLVKLFSILCCIVLFIGLCSFTVSAERVVDKNGWYSFTNSDLVDIFRFGGFYSFLDVKFPIFANSGTNGSTNGFYVDLVFATGSENDWISIPNGYTVFIETEVKFLEQHGDGTAWYNGFEAGNQFDVMFGAYDSNLEQFFVSYSNYQNSSSDSTRIYNITWNNDTGKTAFINQFQFGNVSGFKGTGYDYHMYINYLKFRVMSDDDIATDKIVNGWSPDPQRPAGSDVADQQQQLENQINQNTEVGREESSNLMNGFASHISQFGGGFALFLGMFNRMIPVGWLNAMLSISLALGLFMLVFNLVPSLVSRIGNNKAGNKKGG